MNPTQEQIKGWIDKASAPNAPNSVNEFSISGFTEEPLKYMKRFLLEMKVQIDRWDLVMEYLFIHPHVEKMFISYLDEEVDQYMVQGGRRVPSIWGCSIIANEFVPEDMLIGFYEGPEGLRNTFSDDGRNIALGKLDLKLLNKVNQMKAFW
jgi:hypothetical protein